MPLTYANAPINEVVLGVQFVPQRDLLVPHFGQFWRLIDDAYPGVEHAPPFVMPGGQPIIEPTGALLPRVWFVSKDQSRLVQLQQDFLMVNWRQLPLAMEYPRFPTIRSEFERIFNLFSDFIAKVMTAPLQPTKYQLTYISAVPKGEGWTRPADISRVFRDYCWQGGPRFLPEPTNASWNYAFQIAGTSLQAKFALGKRLRDNTDVLRAELLALADASPDLRMMDWVDKAHDIVVGAFKDMATEQVQRDHWKLVE